jgi:hypothetical protein
MSDSLVLTGVKDVRKHTGTEMLRRNPKGGGDTFQLKRWWVEGGISTVYEDATVFDVTTAAGTVKLALATSMSTNVRIDHDGSFNFTFIGANELSRAALYTDAFELIEHYVLPSISGGKVMTVTPAGGASRPTPGPATGPVTGVTMTNTATTQGDGSITGQNTVSSNGSGLTVDYDVASNVISNVTVNAAGNGYEAGDEFTIVATGGTAKGTVSI